MTLKADGVQEQDFRRLLDLSDAPENQLVRKDRKVVIDFREDLETSTRARLTRLLDIIKRTERRKDPVFAWHVEALDAKLARSLGLAEHPARDYPIDLDVRSGRPAVGVVTNGFESAQGMGGHQYCVYEIPLRNSLPEDAFTDSVVARKRESSVPDHLLERMRNEFGDLTSRDADAARKHVVALDPELDSLTTHMLLEERRTLVITFGEGTRLASRMLWQLDPDEGLGIRDEALAACHARISAAGEAFYRDLLFADISGHVESYRFEQVMF